MTLPPPVTEILNTLLASLQDSLGENLVGLYLRGSLALGDFIPETSDLDILAITETLVFLFHQPLIRFTTACFSCNSLFAQQSRLMTERIFEFSTMLVRDRLVHELVRIADDNLAGDGTAVIDPAPTHYDLAARISTHREAVSREMSRLTKLGLISKTGRRLAVHDIAGLRAARTSQDDA